MPPDSNTRHATIKRNLNRIRERIARAALRAGRDPETVRLVAVTKMVGIEEAGILYGLGIRHLGENRADVARPKIEAMNHPDICWHMIGNIQRRKVRHVVECFQRVDAIDRISLAEALHARCETAGKTMSCLMEVNVSGESSKHGFAPHELDSTLDKLRGLDRLDIEGLLTMAPSHADEIALRRVFRTLRTLAESHGLKTLSMGMTNDFETAIEEGATEIRIGRALYA